MQKIINYVREKNRNGEEFNVIIDPQGRGIDDRNNQGAVSA
ncbi:MULTISPECIES: hypothetical protein [Bradyrhizobium]|nr:hypothetical protein [Bradyrhizobium centrosematis]MCS3764789.1 hypothetical protein [Bradyrhizobium centrosematis]MCS3776159.1 hypothetical protein [Bradyrhizobium centrosematis]